MIIKKTTQTPREEAEKEHLQALVAKQEEAIQNQDVLIHYLAGMCDVFIPDETAEEVNEGYVQDVAET